MSIQTKCLHKLLPIVPDAQVEKETYTTSTITTTNHNNTKRVNVVSLTDITELSQKMVPNGDYQIFLFKF